MQHVEHEIDRGFTQWSRPFGFWHEITQFYAHSDFRPTWSSSNQLNLCVLNANFSPPLEFPTFLVNFFLLVTWETFFLLPSSERRFFNLIFSLYVQVRRLCIDVSSLWRQIYSSISFEMLHENFVFTQKNKNWISFSLGPDSTFRIFYFVVFTMVRVSVDSRRRTVLSEIHNVFVSNLEYMWRDLWQLLCVYHSVSK